MPTSAEILEQLSRIANQLTPIAIAWHLVLAGALVALLVGWRPRQATARVLLAVPLVSVAAAATVFAYPFNALVFAIGSGALIALGITRGGERVQRAPLPVAAIGLGMIAFGWLYPHFLTGSPLLYLIAAPVGLLPCPTLSIVLGLALLGDGLGKRSWMLALASLGVVYALFGMFRLGVWLDGGLLVGSTALFARAWPARAPHPA